jgi:mono/diheme cytochrome c family protein
VANTRWSKAGAWVLAGGALSAAFAAQAQQRVDAGRVEYEAHCAVCHGPAGAGNGELRRFLTVPPSDLTTLSKRNGGAFPNQLVWEVIDGRSSTEIGPHGPRTMPVWGQRYRQEALQQASTAAEPEWYVRNRIVALLDYLSRLQQK